MDPWFRPLHPGIPVIDSILQRTVLRRRARGGPYGGMATELQRLIDLRFLGAKPDDADAGG